MKPGGDKSGQHGTITMISSNFQFQLAKFQPHSTPSKCVSLEGGIACRNGPG
jgi:hypothetical protein